MNEELGEGSRQKEEQERKEDYLQKPRGKGIETKYFKTVDKVL